MVPGRRGDSEDGRGSPSKLQGNTQSDFTTRLSKKNLWLELISTFWMIMLILTMCCIAFYTTGVMMLRRNGFSNNTDTLLSRNVYYFHVLGRDSRLSFELYKDYLQYMATSFPNLRYHVIFLKDDALRPLTSLRFKYEMLKELKKRDVQLFLSRFSNVNIHVTYLSRYIATLPEIDFKYKWKNMSRSLLTLHLRVLSVWKTGGIALDLNTFNDNYWKRCYDSRVTSILKQHNDGLKPRSYAKVYSKKLITQEKALSETLNIVSQFLNESNTVFNMITKAMVANKMNFSDKIVMDDASKQINSSNGMLANDTSKPKSTNGLFFIITLPNGIPNRLTNVMPQTKDEAEKSVAALSSNGSYSVSTKSNSQNDSIQLSKVVPKNDKASRIEAYTVLDVFEKKRHYSKQAIILDMEGLFIASATPMHPFLESLVHSKVYYSTDFIQNALTKHCSSIRYYDYCDSIYLI